MVYHMVTGWQAAGSTAKVQCHTLSVFFALRAVRHKPIGIRRVFQDCCAMQKQRHFKLQRPQLAFRIQVAAVHVRSKITETAELP
jgi:hypothetical protein